MVPWLKAAVLANLFYSESPPITTDTPNQCTSLSTRVYDCPTPPISSNCLTPFIGSVRNEDTCVIDGFNKTFSLAGVDRMMIDPTASVDVNVHYSMTEFEETNHGIPSTPLSPWAVPDDCDEGDFNRYVKNNITSFWLICYQKAYGGHIQVYFGTVSGTSVTYDNLFQIKWDYVQRLDLAKAEAINGVLALRVDVEIELGNVCVDLETVGELCSDLGRPSALALTNVVYVCSDSRCASSSIEDDNSDAFVTMQQFKPMPPPFNKHYALNNMNLDGPDPFLENVTALIMKVRESTVSSGLHDRLNFLFPVQLTYSLYDGGIWLTYMDPSATFYTRTQIFAGDPIMANIISTEYTCSSPTNCLLLDGGEPNGVVTMPYIPIEFEQLNHEYNVMVLSSVCVDRNPGGCSNLVVFHPDKLLPNSNSDGTTIQMTSTVPVGLLDLFQDAVFTILPAFGADFSQRLTYSSFDENNPLACWILIFSSDPVTGRNAKYEWGALITEYLSNQPSTLIDTDIDWRDLARNDGNPTRFDGLTETSYLQKGFSFTIKPITDYNTDYDKFSWYNQLIIDRDFPQVGSLLLSTVDNSHMLLTTLPYELNIDGQAYYEHTLDNFHVYLIVNGSHAIFGNTLSQNYSLATTPARICMVKHSDQARVVRIYGTAGSLMLVNSYTFHKDGSVTQKSGTSDQDFSAGLVLLCNQDDQDASIVQPIKYDLWIYTTSDNKLNPGFEIATVAYSQTDSEEITNAVSFNHKAADQIYDLSDTWSIASMVFRSISQTMEATRNELYVILAQNNTADWYLIYDTGLVTESDAAFTSLDGASSCSGLTLSYNGPQYNDYATVLCQVAGDKVLFILNVEKAVLHKVTEPGLTTTYGTMVLRRNDVYLALFNTTAVKVVHAFVESGDFTHSFRGTDPNTTVFFPVPAELQVHFMSGDKIKLHGGNTLSNLQSKARVAVESTAQIKLFFDSSYDSFEVPILLTVPALDNPSLATFYFFNANGNISATALLTNSEEKPESNIMNLFGQSNIKWYGCPSVLGEVGVPFVTTDSLSACTTGVSVLEPFDTNAANLLTQYRLGVETNEDVMLCWGASNVTLGLSCGSHPVVHGSTTDCGVADGGSVDPFDCAVDGEIFSFATVQHTVTTQCISFSGTCADSAIFPPTNHSLGFSACQAECINQPFCFFFEHGNGLDCRIHIRSLNAQLFFSPCQAGFLGFKCRDSTSADVLQTTVVLDPTPAQSSDPSFYTNITRGTTFLMQIIHGYANDSTIEVDQIGGDRNFLLTFFPNGSTVTGGTVAYVCGQEPPASPDHSNTTILFTHPASEDDQFKNVTVQECYHSTHPLSQYEQMLMDAPEQTTRSCTPASDNSHFYAMGFDDTTGERFHFYNTDHEPTKLDASTQHFPTTVITGPILDEYSYTVSFQSPFFSNNLNYGPLPGTSIKTVVATNDPINVQATNEWLQLALLPTEHVPHDIRPVRLETVVGAESTSNYASNGGDAVDPATDLKQYRITGQPNLELSDVFWGRHNNFKAYFFQLENKASLSNETDTLAKYIFSMTEAVSTNLCPPESNGNRCVLGRLTAPVMNPLFSDVVTVHGRKFAVGFTPYRVSPFVGIYLEGTGQPPDAMVMPDDGFVFEHGGVGYGAASTCDDGTTIFSFGGLDYGPDPKYRQFELLPFDMPAPLRWQPVWYRESVAFGCATEAETCTHDFEENVFPQGDKANLNSRFESVLHSIGHSHSKNNFYHYAAIRNIDSINPAPDSSCGTGDYTINMKLLCAPLQRRPCARCLTAWQVRC
jgi:hypothetical protein